MMHAGTARAARVPSGDGTAAGLDGERLKSQTEHMVDRHLPAEDAEAAAVDQGR